jgi:hypothetical protein
MARPSLFQFGEFMTELEIKNLALLHVGAEPMTETEDSKKATVINTRFAPTRDRLVSEYMWKFALKRTVLESTGDAPAFGFLSTHKLPIDCLFVINSDDLLEIEFDVEDGYLLSDETGNLNVKYISKVTDASKFSPLFCEVLALHLAGDIAYSVTQSKELSNDLYAKASDMIAKARSLNSMQSSAKEFIATTFTSARY